jgi:hypothetical protein
MRGGKHTGARANLEVLMDAFAGAILYPGFCISAIKV